MFDSDRFLFRVEAGHLEAWDDTGKVVAIVHRPEHPLLGCLAFLVGAIAFFAFPIPALWLFCRATGFSFDTQHSVAWQVVLVIAAIVLAFFVAMAVGHSIIPRARTMLYADPSRRTLLLEIVQGRTLFQAIYLRHAVRDGKGNLVGRIRQNNERRRYGFFDGRGRRVATFCAEPHTQPVAWSMEDVLKVAFGILVGLATSVFVIVTPGRNKEKEPSECPIRAFEERSGEPGRRLGMVIFDPDCDFPYEFDLSADPERKLDRRLAVALATLLEW